MIKTKIVPFSPILTSGLQDITDPDIDSTPIAIYIHLFASERDDSPGNSIHRSIGASDGTNQWVCHGWWAYNGSVEQGMTFRDDQIVRNFSKTALALRGTASAIGGGAGPLSNGWRLNWTYTGSFPDTQHGYVIFFYGSSAVASVGIHNGPSDVVLGFTPKLIFSHCASVDLNSINTTDVRLAQGVASTDGITTNVGGTAFTIDSGGPAQGNACFGDQIPSSGTSGSFTYTYDPLIVPGTLRLTATGMGTNAAGFLALDWTGSQRYTTNNVTSNTTLNVGWKPQIFGVLGAGGIFGTPFGFNTYPALTHTLFDWYGTTNGQIGGSFCNDAANNGAIRHHFNSAFVKYYFVSSYIRLVNATFTPTGVTTTNTQGNPNADWVIWSIEDYVNGSPAEHTSNSFISGPAYLPPRGDVDNLGNYSILSPGNFAFSTDINFDLPENLVANNRLAVIFNIGLGDTFNNTLQGNRLIDSLGNVLSRSTFDIACYSRYGNYFYVGEHSFGDVGAINQLQFQTFDINSSGSGSLIGGGYTIFDPDTVPGNGYYFNERTTAITSSTDVWETVCTINIAQTQSEKWSFFGNPNVVLLTGTIDTATPFGAAFEARIRINGVVVSDTISEVFHDVSENLPAFVPAWDIQLDPGPATVILEVRTVGNIATGDLFGSLMALRNQAFEAEYISGVAPTQIDSVIGPGDRNITNMVTSPTADAAVVGRIGLPTGDSSFLDGTLTPNPSTSRLDSSHYSFVQRTLINVPDGTTAQSRSNSSVGPVQQLVLKFIADSSVTDTVSYTTNSLLENSSLLPISHTTDSLLLYTVLVSSNTSSLLQDLNVTVVNTTNSLLIGTYTLNHTTNSLLQFLNVTVVNTTNSLLQDSVISEYYTDSLLQLINADEIHTTDSLIQDLNVTVVNTTDSLLEGSGTLSHSTSSLFQDLNVTVVHITNSLLIGTYVLNQTTDSLLEGSGALSHSTSSLLQDLNVTVVHTTDSLLIGTYVLNQTTDSLLEGSGTLGHSISSLLQNLNVTVVNTTNSLLIGTYILNHTTDLLLGGSGVLQHIANSLLQDLNVTVVHTTNSLLEGSGTLSHSTNSLLQDLDVTVVNTTNSLLIGTYVLNQTTDSLLEGSGALSHSTSSLFQDLNITVVHTTDSLLIGTYVLNQTTDSLLEGSGALSHSTSSLLQDLDVTVVNTTNSLLEGSGVLSYTTNSSLQSLDVTVVNTTDSLLIGTYVLNQTIDSLLEGSGELSYTTNSSLQSLDVTVFHTIDSLLIGTYVLNYTTDSLLMSIDIINVHTTVSLLQSLDVISDHFTDSLLAFNINNYHTNDSLLFLLRILGHSASSLLSGSFFSAHSTSSFLYDFTIRGSAEFFVGVNLDANGIVNNFNSTIDPSCLNGMILGKYGWEQTSTPTKTFSKCDIKR